MLYKIPADRENGKDTNVTTEQRMHDTDVYCAELQLKLIEDLNKGTLPFNKDMLFMHDSIFSVNEHVMPEYINGDPDIGTRRWWESDAALNDWINKRKFTSNKTPDERTNEYLKES